MKFRYIYCEQVDVRCSMPTCKKDSAEASCRSGVVTDRHLVAEHVQMNLGDGKGCTSWYAMCQHSSSLMRRGAIPPTVWTALGSFVYHNGGSSYSGETFENTQ
jgi:hypothetical protein